MLYSYDAHWSSFSTNLKKISKTLTVEGKDVEEQAENIRMINAEIPLDPGLVHLIHGIKAQPAVDGKIM